MCAASIMRVCMYVCMYVLLFIEDNDGLSAASEYVQIFMINVGIEKACDLKKADLMGKSDPYLRVTAFGQTYTTKTIMKTLDPVWNERTTFVFFKDPGKLHFEVWDWDKGTKDDSIGDVDLSLNGFFEPNSNGFNGKLKLQNVKKGEIYVSVTCRKLVPSELEEKAKKLTSETDQQKIDIDELNNNINTTRNNNTRLTNEITNLETKIGECKHEISELEKDIDARKATQNELQQEYDRRQEEKKEAQEKCDQVKKEMESVKAELTKAKNELEKAKEENENLEHESNTLEKQVKEAQAEKEREEANKAAAAAASKRSSSKKKSDSATAGLTSNEERIDVSPPASKCCTIL